MANIIENSSKRRNLTRLKYLIPSLKREYLVEQLSLEDIASKHKISIDDIRFLLKNIIDSHHSKPEITLFDILSTIYPNSKIHEQFPIDNLRLDFYIPSMRLAFEYDGEFHDKPHPKAKNPEKSLKKTKELDAKKDRLSEENGWTLIRIHHSKKDILEETILAELKKINLI